MAQCVLSNSRIMQRFLGSVGLFLLLFPGIGGTSLSVQTEEPPKVGPVPSISDTEKVCREVVRIERASGTTTFSIYPGRSAAAYQACNDFLWKGLELDPLITEVRRQKALHLLAIWEVMDEAEAEEPIRDSAELERKVTGGKVSRYVAAPFRIFKDVQIRGIESWLRGFGERAYVRKILRDEINGNGAYTLKEAFQKMESSGSEQAKWFSKWRKRWYSARTYDSYNQNSYLQIQNHLFQVAKITAYEPLDEIERLLSLDQIVGMWPPLLNDLRENRHTQAGQKVADKLFLETALNRAEKRVRNDLKATGKEIFSDDEVIKHQREFIQLIGGDAQAEGERRIDGARELQKEIREGKARRPEQMSTEDWIRQRSNAAIAHQVRSLIDLTEAKAIRDKAYGKIEPDDLHASAFGDADQVRRVYEYVLAMNDPADRSWHFSDQTMDVVGEWVQNAALVMFPLGLLSDAAAGLIAARTAIGGRLLLTTAACSLAVNPMVRQGARALWSALRTPTGKFVIRLAAFGEATVVTGTVFKLSENVIETPLAGSEAWENVTEGIRNSILIFGGLGLVRGGVRMLFYTKPMLNRRAIAQGVAVLDKNRPPVNLPFTAADTAAYWATDLAAETFTFAILGRLEHVWSGSGVDLDTTFAQELLQSLINVLALRMGAGGGRVVVRNLSGRTISINTSPQDPPRPPEPQEQKLPIAVGQNWAEPVSDKVSNEEHRTSSVPMAGVPGGSNGKDGNQRGRVLSFTDKERRAEKRNGINGSGVSTGKTVRQSVSYDFMDIGTASHLEDPALGVNVDSHFKTGKDVAAGAITYGPGDSRTDKIVAVVRRRGSGTAQAGPILQKVLFTLRERLIRDGETADVRRIFDDEVRSVSGDRDPQSGKIDLCLIHHPKEGGTQIYSDFPIAHVDGDGMAVFIRNGRGSHSRVDLAKGESIDVLLDWKLPEEQDHGEEVRFRRSLGKSVDRYLDGTSSKEESEAGVLRLMSLSGKERENRPYMTPIGNFIHHLLGDPKAREALREISPIFVELLEKAQAANDPDLDLIIRDWLSRFKRLNDPPVWTKEGWKILMGGDLEKSPAVYADGNKIGDLRTQIGDANVIRLFMKVAELASEFGVEVGITGGDEWAFAVPGDPQATLAKTRDFLSQLNHTEFEFVMPDRSVKKVQMTFTAAYGTGISNAHHFINARKEEGKRGDLWITPEAMKYLPRSSPSQVSLLERPASAVRFELESPRAARDTHRKILQWVKWGKSFLPLVSVTTGSDASRGSSRWTRALKYLRPEDALHLARSATGEFDSEYLRELAVGSKFHAYGDLVGVRDLNQIDKNLLDHLIGTLVDLARSHGLAVGREDGRVLFTIFPTRDMTEPQFDRALWDFARAWDGVNVVHPDTGEPLPSTRIRIALLPGQEDFAAADRAKEDAVDILKREQATPNRSFVRDFRPTNPDMQITKSVGADLNQNLPPRDPFELSKIPSSEWKESPLQKEIVARGYREGRKIGIIGRTYPENDPIVLTVTELPRGKKSFELRHLTHKYVFHSMEEVQHYLRDTKYFWLSRSRILEKNGIELIPTVITGPEGLVEVVAFVGYGGMGSTYLRANGHLIKIAHNAEGDVGYGRLVYEALILQKLHEKYPSRYANVYRVGKNFYELEYVEGDEFFPATGKEEQIAAAKKLLPGSVISMARDVLDAEKRYGVSVKDYLGENAKKAPDDRVIIFDMGVSSVAKPSSFYEEVMEEARKLGLESSLDEDKYSWWATTPEKRESAHQTLLERLLTLAKFIVRYQDIPSIRPFIDDQSPLGFSEALNQIVKQAAEKDRVAPGIKGFQWWGDVVIDSTASGWKEHRSIILQDLALILFAPELEVGGVPRDDWIKAQLQGISDSYRASQQLLLALAAHVTKTDQRDNIVDERKIDLDGFPSENREWQEKDSTEIRNLLKDGGPESTRSLRNAIDGFARSRGMIGSRFEAFRKWEEMVFARVHEIASGFGVSESKARERFQELLTQENATFESQPLFLWASQAGRVLTATYQKMASNLALLAVHLAEGDWPVEKALRWHPISIHHVRLRTAHTLSEIRPVQLSLAMELERFRPMLSDAVRREEPSIPSAGRPGKEMFDHLASRIRDAVRAFGVNELDALDILREIQGNWMLKSEKQKGVIAANLLEIDSMGLEVFLVNILRNGQKERIPEAMYKFRTPGQWLEWLNEVPSVAPARGRPNQASLFAPSEGLNPRYPITLLRWFWYSELGDYIGTGPYEHFLRFHVKSKSSSGKRKEVWLWAHDDFANFRRWVGKGSTTRQEWSRILERDEHKIDEGFRYIERALYFKGAAASFQIPTIRSPFKVGYEDAKTRFLEVEYSSREPDVTLTRNLEVISNSDALKTDQAIQALVGHLSDKKHQKFYWALFDLYGWDGKISFAKVVHNGKTIWILVKPGN